MTPSSILRPHPAPYAPLSVAKRERPSMQRRPCAWTQARRYDLVVMLIPLVIAASLAAQPVDVKACRDGAWDRLGGKILSSASADAKELTEQAARITRSLGYKPESMDVRVIEVGEGIAVYFAPRTPGALGGDVAVFFRLDQTVCVLRGL